MKSYKANFIFALVSVLSVSFGYYQKLQVEKFEIQAEQQKLIATKNMELYQRCLSKR